MTWQLVTTQWSFEPLVLVPLCVTGLLYWIGELRSAPRPLWRVLCFYGGLLTILIALQSPIDALDGQLFWVHMLQHLLLIMVAAPLLILGDPAMPMIRAWPLQPRRRALRLVSSSNGARRAGSVLGRLNSPWVAGGVLLIDLYLWHWAPLFNLTLQNQGVHDLEHICFLGTALLFWSQVIDMRAVHIAMSYVERAAYIAVVGAAGNILAMYLVFARRPLYSAYANLHPRPYGLSALADQQMAGALMWVPVLFVFATAFCVCMYRWLGEEEKRSDVSDAVPAYRLLDGSLPSESHG